MNVPGRLIAVVPALVALTACSSNTSSDDFGVTASWSRPTPAGADQGVVYMFVTTDLDDELISAEVPRTVAGAAELHRSMMQHAQGGGHHGEEGGAPEPEAAVKAEAFPIAPGSPLVFQPGGNHVMLLDLVDPLSIGERFPLTLSFSSGRELTTDVVVADNPPD